MKNLASHKLIHCKFHATTRMAQRNISDTDIEYVLTYGKKIFQRGSITYFLGNHDIPLEDSKVSQISRLAGTAVVTDPKTGEIITVWRNRKTGMKYLKNSHIKSN